MRIVIGMSNRTRVVETTSLDYHSSILLADDYMPVVDMEKNGILLERCAYTTAEESGRMSLKAEPLEIVPPENLDEVDYVDVNGMPFLVREGDRLIACSVDQLYDEEGDVVAPPMASAVLVVYKSGSVETIDPTMMLYPDGFLAQDDLMDCSDIRGKGVLWERAAWTVADPDLMSLTDGGEAIRVIAPEDLPAIEAIVVNGEVVYISGETSEEGVASGEGTRGVRAQETGGGHNADSD